MYYKIETYSFEFDAMGTKTQRVTLKAFRYIVLNKKPYYVCGKTRCLKTNMYTGSVIKDETHLDQQLLLEAEEIEEFERTWNVVKRGVE